MVTFMLSLGAPLVAVLLAVAQSTTSTQLEPREGGFVGADGVPIHYVDWGGEGRPPLVLVHGLDRTARTFDHVAPHFRSRYRVIAYDMRGHGESGWDPDGRYRVEDHVRDLAALVAHLRLKDVRIWGNSTGGRVAQVFAGLHPGLVSHVIAEDVGPERPRSIADSYARRVAQEENGWASEEELLATVRKTNPAMVDAVLHAYVRHGAKRREDGRLVWKRDPNLVKGFVETDLWEYVRRIEAPILYVLGGRSTIVSRAAQEELQRTLPKAQIVTMADVGHYPSDERPEEFVAVVDRFLARE
jgi:pimeloyl-ACP methyl ester carboxylesterase